MFDFKLILFFILNSMCIYNGNAQMDLIGANVDSIVDWSRAHPFVDLVKQSRKFGHPDQPWVTSLSLPVIGSDGWPISDFGVILWIDEKTPMNGTYKILYVSDSQPIIKFQASSGIIANHTYNAVSKIGSADLLFPVTGTQLMLSFRNTTNGLRNLKVIRPGYDPLNPPTFTTPYIFHHKRFNTIRFMDWGRTNANPVKYWSERTTQNRPSMTSDRGVALEYMIELGNTLNRNIWICIPHQADDDYVRNTALLIQSQLNTNLAVYIEYSNEVWNWQFSQAHWNLNAATQEANGTASNLNYDSINNPGYWAWRRTARRIKEISDIFRSVFGDSQMMTRIRPVLAGQIAYSEGMKTGLKFINDVYGPPKNFFYALAGAPYFNLNGGDSGNLTKDDVLTLMEQNILAMKTDRNIQDYAALGAKYGLPILAYEGGSDTFGPNAIQAKKIASFDPKMETLCINYLNIWYSYGFGLFNWFVSYATNWDTQYGSWGLTDVLTNLDTPKIRAIDYVRSQNKPPLIYGEPVPGTIDGRAYLGNTKNPWKFPDYPILYNYFFDYVIRSNITANYFLTLNIGTKTSVVALRVQANNNAVSNITVVNNNNTPTRQAYIIVALTAGLNNLRISYVNGSFTIHGLTLAMSQPTPIITSQSSALVIATFNFNYQIIAANFPIQFDAVGLPVGLTVNTTTGLISGTVASAGNYLVTISAANSGGSDAVTLNLTVMSSLLLKDNFNYADGVFHGSNGGSGFTNGWLVQNDRSDVYKIASVNPLLWNGASFSSYATGGGAYLSSGRRIDTTYTFKSFIDTNGVDIGADGTTLWFSVLFRKQKSNDGNCFVSLHPQSSVIWSNGATRIEVGYFGSGSNSNTVRYWSLKYGDAKPVIGLDSNLAVNTTARLVLRLNFGIGDNSDTASLFYNPNPLVEPTIANAIVTSATIRFRSIAYYSGSDIGDSSIDDVKLGVSYSSLNL